MTDVPVYLRTAAYLIILVGYFFYCYNFTIIDYVKPFLEEDYGITLEQSAFFYTLQSIGCIIGAFGCAWACERFGRKNILIFITALNGLATIANMLIVDYQIWLFMRFIIGISLGGYYTAAVSTMVGLFKPDRRGMVTAIAYSMFSLSGVVMGAYGAIVSESGWENLLWLGGIPPVVSAFLMLFLVPDEKKYEPYANDTRSTETETIKKKGTWAEMFSKRYVKITVICILMSGINFAGGQFFGGFVTVYLREIRGFDASAMGALIALSAIGNLVGAYAWGFIADRFGRKVNASGFFLSALMVALYFIVPSNLTLLTVLGFLYNFGLASTSIWGGYFTELFPVHLRSMGASLFHGGRIIALLSPYLVIVISNSTNLTTAMWGAPILFIIAGLLWVTQPETLKKGKLYKDYDPNAA